MVIFPTLSCLFLLFCLLPTCVDVQSIHSCSSRVSQHCQRHLDDHSWQGCVLFDAVYYIFLYLFYSVIFHAVLFLTLFFPYCCTLSILLFKYLHYTFYLGFYLYYCLYYYLCCSTLSFDVENYSLRSMMSHLLWMNILAEKKFCWSKQVRLSLILAYFNNWL